jgi:hypothetical protein
VHRVRALGRNDASELCYGRAQSFRCLVGLDQGHPCREESERLRGGQAEWSSEVLCGIDVHLVFEDVDVDEVARSVSGEAGHEHDMEISHEFSGVFVSETFDDVAGVRTALFDDPGQHREDPREPLSGSIGAHTDPPTNSTSALRSSGGDSMTA